MSSRSYSLVIDGADAMKFLAAVDKDPNTALPGYGIRGFIRITKDIKSPRKKAKDLKAGDILANLALRSENPWDDYPNTFDELEGLSFNIWRLEWFKTNECEDGGREIKYAEYIDLPEYNPDDDNIDYVSRKWIMDLIAPASKE
jgi:hypothetical protein